MRIPALAKPLALTAALTLTLAACGGKDAPAGGGSSSDGGASTPAISMPAPDGFNTSKPVIAPTALMNAKSSNPENIKAALSPDGTHLATWTIDGTTAQITEYDLTTGDKTEHKPYADLLTPDGSTSGPLVQVRYISNDQLALLTRGTIKGEGASEDTEKWKLATYNSGKKSDPLATIEQDGEANLSDETVGPVISYADKQKDSAPTATFDPTTGAVTPSSTMMVDGCHQKDCNLPATPTVEAADTMIYTYDESLGENRDQMCKYDKDVTPSGSCLVGFRTDSWTSSDPGIAPEGAVPSRAYITATDGENILASWYSTDGKSAIYRVINPQNPTEQLGTFTIADNTPVDSPEAPLSFSPDHKYLTVGSLTADLDAKTGVYFGDTEGTKDAVFGGVTDEGMTWGVMGAEEGDQVSTLPWLPSSTAITATAGTTTSKSTDGEVNVPRRIITTPNGPAGVFIDNKAAGGKPAAAVYPVG